MDKSFNIEKKNTSEFYLTVTKKNHKEVQVHVHVVAQGNVL